MFSESSSCDFHFFPQLSYLEGGNIKLWLSGNFDVNADELSLYIQHMKTFKHSSKATFHAERNGTNGVFPREQRGPNYTNHAVGQPLVGSHEVMVLQTRKHPLHAVFTALLLC